MWLWNLARHRWAVTLVLRLLFLVSLLDVFWHLTNRVLAAELSVFLGAGP